MATLAERFEIRNDTSFLNRITAAVAEQADVVRLESDQVANHANRLVWAKQAFTNPEAVAKTMLWGIISANRAFTAAQITGAADSALVGAVADLVNVYATGG